MFVLFFMNLNINKDYKYKQGYKCGYLIFNDCNKSRLCILDFTVNKNIKVCFKITFH